MRRIRWRGWATVVSGTVAVLANSMLSWPTMDQVPAARGQPDGLLQQSEGEEVVGAEHRGGTAGYGDAGEAFTGPASLGDVHPGGLQHGERLGALPGDGALPSRAGVGAHARGSAT